MLLTTMNIKIISFISMAIEIFSWPAQASKISDRIRNLSVSVSTVSAHVITWRKTPWRITRILVESPEKLAEKIVFSVPGCSKNACGKNSALILINTRSGIRSGSGAIRVVTEKEGEERIYRIKINIVKGEIKSNDIETEFVQE
jgi:hypothetical protein